MKLTVYFDGQFWVALIERSTDQGLAALRHVFGAEPHDDELLAFTCHTLPKLFDRMTVFVPSEQRALRRPSPKRMARLAARELRAPAGSTKAQAALQAQVEANKRARAERSRAEREAEARRRYQLAREKARQRHRGR